MAQDNNRLRFLARVIIEAASPLQIGSGEKNIKTDSLVLRDVNGLPFIPGTTIAGLIKHSLDKTLGERLLGSQKEGSPLVITEARMLNDKGKVMDGIINRNTVDNDTKEFLASYDQLPIRQHVRISHRGTAEDKGKFDEEIVLKGTRFCFEMEMASSEGNDAAAFKLLLTTIQNPVFRIGAGSRSGFGKIKVVKCLFKQLDLTDETSKESYLSKSSSLAAEWKGWADAEDCKAEIDESACEGWTAYKLKLQPEDLVLFGSGFGDEKGNADMTYVKESYISWTDTETGMKAERIVREKVLLIPASSVKGALAHRTAFYYNKLSEAVIEADGSLRNGKTIKEVTGKNNAAVKSIFGSEGEKDEDTKKMVGKQRGNILISDVIEVKENTSPKILNHVSIDRFTGGAIDGALFTEETLYAKGQDITIDILVNNDAFIDKDVRPAFESALKDITTGMLPLGGGVNRGNGCFTGNVSFLSKENKWEELA